MEPKKKRKSPKRKKRRRKKVEIKNLSNFNKLSRLHYCCSENLPLFMLFFRHSN